MAVELFMPIILDRLIDVTTQQIGEKVNLIAGVEEEVDSLKKKFDTLAYVLEDAERRKIKESPIWAWLEQLEDIAYEMEDVLEEWHIKFIKPQQVRAKSTTRMPTTLLDKVHSLIQSLCSCVNQLPGRNDIALKIREINRKLGAALEEANNFSFVVGRTFSGLDSKACKARVSTSIIDISQVQGREFDKKSLLKHLFQGSKGGIENDVIKVISIVGVGGSGKTTLAQLLYNDDKVKKHFVRKWVCVSNTFDEERVSKALLEDPEMSATNNHQSELESLLQNLKTFFSGKIFFIVFDDVWTEDYSKWRKFKDSLQDGAPGSIILVTTRKESVARVVGTDYLHMLGLLTKFDCWTIIKQRALSKRSELCKSVESIGKKIAKKCKGLPLAAEIIGSLLQYKDSLQEWCDVLDDEIWQLETEEKLFPHFYLSYRELCPRLKKCFSYCGVFPKDHIFEAENMISLWMAQGYLGNPSRKGNDRMERIGQECIKSLIMHSFFKNNLAGFYDRDKVIEFKMHDIVHDFAQHVGKHECRRVFEKVDCQMVEGSEGNTSTRRFRHVNMLGSVKSMNLITRDIEKVRSLFFHPSSFIPQDLFTSLKAVRSLKLSNCGLLELPQEIGDLIHIRLLDVSKNQFTELPESICNLHYLQSLYVDECEKLGQLPQRFGDLVHLRHLYMDETNQLKKMPQEIEKLTSLRTLGKFIVDDDEPANNIVKLKKLNHLESLNMHVHRDVDFENAELGDKIYLDWLKLVFEGEGFDSGNKSLLETMEPPPNLKELFIFNYPAIHLPKWILAQTLVNNLKYLHLCGAHSVSSLPSLWKFQSLQVLTLEFLLNLKCFGREFYGLPNDFQPKVFRKDGVANVVAFPSLKSLTLRQLSLETWEDISEEDDEKLSISIMPRLQNLGVQSCNKLNSLPHRIVGKASSLKWLHIHTCKTLEERYSKNTKEDWRKLSPAPAVRILVNWENVMVQVSELDEEP